MVSLKIVFLNELAFYIFSNKNNLIAALIEYSEVKYVIASFLSSPE
jgi:hypothetical protein